MGYRLLADLLLILHLLFIVFVIFGAILVVRWRGLMVVHLAAVAWGALVEFAGWVCPLTPLENRARVLAGETGYQGGFIEHYLTAVIYPAGLSRDFQIMLGTLVVVINLLAYLWIFKKKRLNGR